MNRRAIEQQLRRVGRKLQQQGVTGEIVLAGGAAMALLFPESRRTTRDVDAYFLREAEAIRVAVAEVAEERGLALDWLNDAVKGFFLTVPPTQVVREYPGLRVATVTPEYLLAMKASASRPQDIPDLQLLISALGVTSAEEAMTIVLRFVPEHLLLPRVRYHLEDLFAEGNDA